MDLACPHGIAIGYLVHNGGYAKNKHEKFKRENFGNMIEHTF